MNQFFKFLFASCLGTALGLFLLFGIGSFIVGKGIANAGNKNVKIKENSVLILDANGAIPDRTNNLPLDPLSLETDVVIGLTDIQRCLAKAKDDNNIKGLHLKTSLSTLPFATTDALRQSIMDFKESGKFVYVYADNLSQNGYYLATAADSIIMNPSGNLEFRGYGASITFFKKALDKMGVDVEVFYAGKFKSATEPYRLDKMSPENRKQIRERLDSVYNDFLRDVSQARNIPIPELKSLANKHLLWDPKEAVEAGLIDGVSYKEDLKAELKENLGLGEKSKIPMVSMADYYTTLSTENITAKDKIAVIYAEGTIMDGVNQGGMINEKDYVKYLHKAMNDSQVKAVVLRVNSPGGSAFISDVLHHEIEKVKEKGIPVVVSMGNYAASGGYYISANADKIFAQENTLTGSIGVFLTIPIASELFNDKLGITVDTVNTSTFSTSLNPMMEIGQREREELQRFTNKTYDQFLTIVSEGRNIPMEEVKELAQGRVYTGDRALQIGLVDEIGYLSDAIDYAANTAGLEKYKIRNFPPVRDPLQDLLNQITNTESELSTQLLQRELGIFFPHYEALQEIQNHQGKPMMLLPFQVEIK